MFSWCFIWMKARIFSGFLLRDNRFLQCASQADVVEIWQVLRGDAQVFVDPQISCVSISKTRSAKHT